MEKKKRHLRICPWAHYPFFTWLAILLIISCDKEKTLLQTAREVELKITFGRNLAKDGKLVRNGIPVEIKVMANSPEFDDPDVTGIVNWELENSRLDTVFYHPALRSYVYLYQGVDIGRRRITINLDNYSAAMEFEVSPVELVFVSAAGDTFMMGTNRAGSNPHERPPHPVILGPYEMSKYEITNLEYFYFLKEAIAQDSIYFMGGNAIVGYYSRFNEQLCLDLSESLIRKEDLESDIFEPPFANHPVTGVTWWGAYLFARHYGLRLPTEAEWEYACKRKTMNAFPNDDGASLSDYAWYWDHCNSCDKPEEIGQLRQTDPGLYDIHGNVWEWCFDQYKDNFYADTLTYGRWPRVNPIGPDTTNIFQRVIRGGGFSSNANACRSTYRDKLWHNAARDDIGFRVAKAL